MDSTNTTTLEFSTLDQGWKYGDQKDAAYADEELDQASIDGWTVLHVAVHVDCWDNDGDSLAAPSRETYIHRVVTLTRPTAHD